MAQTTPNFNVEGDHQFVDRKKLRRDITPIGTQIFRFVLSPEGFVFINVTVCLIAAVFTSLLYLAVVTPLIMLVMTQLMRKTWHAAVLPLRLPLDEQDRIDYGDPKPSHQGFNKGRGAFFIGTAWRKKQEVWAAFTDVLTHMLVIGGTGAGKSELLLSMTFNALALGGGAIYNDPKGGPKLVGQYWTMARICGRDDDIRLLNFALGQEALGKTPNIRSNTLQPFAFGKGESLKEIPLSLMSGDSEKGGSVFSANGKTMMTGLILGLVDLRNLGEIYLTINDIRTYINSEKYIELATRKDITPVAREAMQSFLVSMGWKESIPDRTKWGDFDRQYSYAQNYFLEILSTLADTYRHIFNVPIGDINMVDVILNRRLFLAAIPALEKSKKELNTLGKVALAVTRLATAVGLGGGEVMGNWKELIDLNVSASEVPSFLVVDEYAAIAVEGFSEVFTQGRSLGISATVGSQDWAGIKKANEAEAQQIVANTKLKFIMTTDDPNDTRQLIKSLAESEMEEMRSQGYNVKGSFNYSDSLSAQATKASRIDIMDLAAQVEGEWHLFFKDRIIRGFGFFAGGIPDDKESPIIVHHLLMVERPNRVTLSAQFGAIGETVDRWIEVVQEAGDNWDAPFEPDYFEMEGCKPLGDVFETLRLCNEIAINKNIGYEDRRGFSPVVPFGDDTRRETVCAAVYSWMNEDNTFTTLKENYQESKAKPSTPPITDTGFSEPFDDELFERPVDMGEVEKSDEKDRPEVLQKKIAETKPDEPATHPVTEEDDDLLSSLERDMAGDESEKTEGTTEENLVNPANVAEVHIEQVAHQDDIDHKSEKPSINREVPVNDIKPESEQSVNIRKVEKPDIPVGKGKRWIDDSSFAFKQVAEFVEETVSESESVITKIAESTSSEPTEEARKKESQLVFKSTKDHVMNVLTDPEYPSPPTPEPIDKSKFRDMAEKWIKQVKES